jgi:hypothetical protein
VDEIMDKPTNTMDLVAYGLTKRDYFAGLAMQSFIALADDEAPGVYLHLVPELAVKMADSLLAELEKEKEE